MFVRRNVPESPRWLFIHGQEEKAEQIVRGIEEGIERDTDEKLEQVDDSIEVRQRESISFRSIGKVAFKLYPKRAILGIALFVGQAFLYNGVTFNLGTLFTTFYGVSSSIVPIFIIIFAFANFFGPLLLGRLFDTLGRIPMIAGTYLGSALAATVLAILFVSHGLSSAWAFEALVGITFFLASAGASAAYLTVSEVFPMETRALAIAFFYAIGTGLGGIIGPLLFGHLIATNDRNLVMVAFLIGAGVMALGGVAELFLGVRAENTQLEDIAKPLTVEEAETGSLPDEETDEDAAAADEPTHAEREELDRSREERWRARAERHRRPRYRLGPGSGEAFYSPAMFGTSVRTRQVSPELLDREIETIAAVLEANGRMGREELARRVGARGWGPGRFRAALREANSEGRISRHRRGEFGPSST
jgi:hypothetical protein